MTKEQAIEWIRNNPASVYEALEDASEYPDFKRGCDGYGTINDYAINRILKIIGKEPLPEMK